MSQSALCQLCWADVETGEVYCLRLGEWVAKCPKSDGDPWGAERAAADDDDEDGDLTTAAQDRGGGKADEADGEGG